MMAVGRQEYCRVLALCSFGVLLLASSAVAFDHHGDHEGGGTTTTTVNSGSTGWSVDLLPSPTLDPVGCGHPRERLRDGSFLCDPDGLLTMAGARRAEEELEKISSLQTPCGLKKAVEGDEQQQQQLGDIEGGVAVVSRMLASPPGGVGGVGINGIRKGGGVGGGEEVTPEGFARGVQDSWRVGKRGCDNGFVLVASREDRSFAISVGKGLERYLPPRDRNAALNAMKPLLREGDWDGAVLLALEEIHRRLLGNLAKAAGGGDGQGALSSLGWGWEDMKRWADGWGSSGGGSSGSGDGGGGGGGFRGFHLGAWDDFFGGNWDVDVPPGSVLLALSLLWGGATARASLQRRRYDRFEAKLARIEAQRAMLPLSAAGGWSAGQDALGSRGVCPICLDAFSAAADDGSGAAAKGLVGADGMPAATLPDCGHTFCQSCLSRWNRDGSDSSKSNPQACPCPICDAPTPAVGDPRLGLTSRRRRAPRPVRRRRPGRRRRRGEEDVGFFGFRWP
ncbi:unnamed protein product, partial [Ectocarpus fasciculatus]